MKTKARIKEVFLTALIEEYRRIGIARFIRNAHDRKLMKEVCVVKAGLINSLAKEIELLGDEANEQDYIAFNDSAKAHGARLANSATDCTVTNSHGMILVLS